MCFRSSHCEFLYLKLVDHAMLMSTSLNRRDALIEHGMGMGDSTIFAMSIIQ